MKKAVNYLLLIYVFILPIIPDTINNHNMTHVSQGILALLGFLYILKCIIYNKEFLNQLKSFFKDPVTIGMAVLLFIMMLTSFEGVNVKLGIRETIRFASYILIYFIVKYEDIDYKRILQIMICSISIILIFGIVQFFTGIGASTGLEGYKYIRVQSTIDNPNSYGGFLNLIIFPIILSFISVKDIKKKIFFGILIVLTLVNIALTMSRNAMVGLLAGFGLLIIFYSFKYIFILAPVAVVSFFIPAVHSRVMSIFDKKLNAARIGTWQMAVDLIKKHPIKGIGNGSFVELYPKLKKNYPLLKDDWAETYPTHNSFLKIQCELGIFGTISFVTILLGAIIKIKKAMNIEDKIIKNIAKGVMISLLVFLVMNCIDNLFFVPKLATFVWVMIAMLDGILYRLNKSSFNRM